MNGPDLDRRARVARKVREMQDECIDLGGNERRVRCLSIEALWSEKARLLKELMGS